MSKIRKADKLTEKQKKKIYIVAVVLLLLFCAAVTYFVGKPMIAFASRPEEFRNWVQARGVFGKLAFVLMVFFQVVLALIPGEPLEIVGGYAFGAVEGTALTVIGTVLGSVTVFFLVKRWGIKLCEVFFPREKIMSLKILKNKKRRDFLAFLIFFLPGTPKDLATYFLGLTDFKLINVIFLSAVARLPSVITSTLGGDALGVKKYTTALIVFAITAVVSCGGLYVYRKLTARKRNK